MLPAELYGRYKGNTTRRLRKSQRGGARIYRQVDGYAKWEIHGMKHTVTATSTETVAVRID